MAATTLEFVTHPNEDGTLLIPPEIAKQLEGIEFVRVVLILQPGDEDKAWATLTTEQFLEGYAASDAIYDQLPAR